MPFWPLPIGLVGLVPVLWYFSFPCKLVFQVGEGFDVRAMLRELGEADWERPSDTAVRAVADRIRAQMQAELDGLVADHHGDRPYRWGELFRALRRGPDRTRSGVTAQRPAGTHSNRTSRADAAPG